MNKLKTVIFDLDDFAEDPERNCLFHLVELKEKFPQLKITLFAIPYWQEVNQSKFFHSILDDYGDWIELAIHGWTHHSNFECMEWDYKTAKKYIQQAYNMGCFVKGFKAPGWQISRDTYSALKNAGFWVADHKVSAYTEPGIPNRERRPRTLRAYEIDHPDMVHGHTWNCVGNGIEELSTAWKKDGYPWEDDAVFKFISEIV